MTSRTHWLDGKYAGRAWCEACAYELVARLWWYDGARRCLSCYRLASKSDPPSITNGHEEIPAVRK